MSRFVREGKLTWLSELLLGGIVVIGLIGIPILNMPLWLAIPIGGLSLIAGVVLMFEGRASALGLKPFTNDPLGWRKAKETYKTDADSDLAKKNDDQA